MAAIELLDGLREVAETEATAEPGEIVLRLSSALDAEPAAAAVLRSLLDAGIPVMEFSLEGGRLSDAFLEVVSP
jgi:ABC-2 type transport system ATP-binding protein